MVRRRSRARRLAPWLAALGAAAAVCWYGWREYRKLGPAVSVTFDDGTGLDKDSLVLRHGVSIGKVRRVALAADEKRAVVDVRLTRDAADFAREGAVYWVVRPRLSEGGLGGLNALASGPYIEARPGDGREKSRFDGLSDKPRPPGLKVTLVAPRLEGLSPGAPVSFRGVAVGEVRDVRLAAAGDAAEARVLIWRRYAPLVRGGSKFWTVSGLAAKGGLFSGIQLKLQSLREVASGGVVFATPEKDAGAPAKDGARFPVAEKPRKEWLGWAPKIAIAPAPESAQPSALLPTGRDLEQAKQRGR